MGHDEFTGLLYAQPSFIAGVARTLDLGGTFDSYNESPSAVEADQLALSSDWYAIGADLLDVVTRFAAKTAGRNIDGKRKGWG